ncbi:MAG: hypothetical protein R3C59_08615 [Planctomycetaceae bacterium]
MNGWDAMLTWLACQERANWNTVKGASQRLSAVYEMGTEDQPLKHARRWAMPLIRLGHAEFDQSDNTVTACPSGIAWSRLRNRGVLYGAWAEDRLRSIERDCRGLIVSTPENGPTCRMIEVPSGELNSLGQLTEDLKVWLADDPGDRILNALPVVTTMLQGLKEDHSAEAGRWQRYEFREHNGRWWDCDRPLRLPGVYRRLSGSFRRVLVTEDGNRFRLPTPDHQCAAQWSIAPRVAWLYDEREQRLLVPSGMPEFPVLVSRGLTSASGMLPGRIRVDDIDWRCFEFVSEDNAGHAARVMGQTLEPYQRIRPTALQMRVAGRIRKVRRMI